MQYFERLVDKELQRLLGAFPAVLVVGPRACGKTTSALRVAASVARLDQPGLGDLFRADPDAALATRAEPALLDEWQDAPEVLGAVKRSVDADSHPGRFVLTGSVTGELDAAAWPGTGRLVRLPMSGLSVRERIGRVADRPSVAGVLRGEVRMPADVPDITGYVDLALASGFPEAARLQEHRDRRLWLDSYVDQLVTRDIARAGERRDPERLRRYVQAWALNSAGIVDDTTIYEAAGLDRRTHLDYEQLLRNLFVFDVVPAWTTNRLKRLVLAPKRYVADSGLFAAMARVGRDDILHSADLTGRLLDTFVMSELRAPLAIDEERPTVAHIRTAGGRQEVDLVVEFGAGRVHGIEIKATSRPRVADARHLLWMAEHLGDRFIGGTVFHTGPGIIELAPRIVALPICALWGTAAAT